MSTQPISAAAAARALAGHLGTALRAALRSHHLWVLLLYLVVTWAVRFGSFEGWTTASYAGSMSEDAGQFIWHFQHLWRVVTGQTDFFFSDRVFYPVGLQMVRQDWAPSAALLALPFQPLGPLAALNIEVLIAFVLCGYFTYLLALRLCGDRVLAFMAGCVFAFCEFRVDKSFGHINQANQQFIPLYLLFMLSYFDTGRWRHAVGAAVAFYLATFCTYYQLIFVLMLTGLYLLFAAGRAMWDAGPHPRAWPAALRPVAWRTLGYGVLVGGASLLLLGPIVLPSWESFLLASRSLTLTMPQYSADLLSYVMSNLYTPPPERIFSGEGGTAFVGYMVLALLLLSVALCRRRTGAGLWIFFSLVFFVISLGSTLVIAGKPVARLPFFDLLQALPVVKGAKVAARFASLVVLSAAVASAITLAHIGRTWLAGWSRSGRRLVTWGAAALVCAEVLIPPARFVHSALPTPFPVPPLYHALAQLPGDMAFLHYPLCWDAFTGNIGPHRFPRQVFAYQTVHHKPIFSGIGNMVPSSTLRYLLRLPLVGDLVRLGNGEPPEEREETEQTARNDAVYAAGVLDLGLILLHKEMTIPGGDRVKERYQEALTYLHRVLAMSLVVEDGERMVFAVKLPRFAAEQLPQHITFEARGSLVHLGGAWSRQRWEGRRLAEASLDSQEEKELYLRLAEGKPADMTLELRCSITPCPVRLWLNGRLLGLIQPGTVMGRHRVRLPETLVRPGLNRLRMEPAGGPGQVSIPVGTTGAASSTGLRVRSAGVKVGDEAGVLQDNRNLVPNTRGYNLAVLDPESGDARAAAAFDLVADADGETARSMVQFIHNVEPGMMVAVAVRDDGSINLTDEVVGALRTLGAALDLRGKLRASYALIGVKGARPGAALEYLSPDPVELELGRRLQIRSIAVDAPRR